MKHFSPTERLGMAFLVGTTILEALTPLYANKTVDLLPPATFLLCAVSMALIALALYIFMTGAWRKIQYSHKFLVTMIFIGLVISSFYAVVFVVSPYTSGINTALLLQTEIISTYLVTTMIFGERLSLYQRLGVLTLFIGTVLVLFQGSLSFNPADLVIALTTFSLPFMNRATQWALTQAPAPVVLGLRYIASIPVYALVALFSGEELVEQISSLSMGNIGYIAIFGLGLFLASKICWYQGLKRLPLGETLYFTSVRPVVALALVVWLLGEIPTWYQLFGCVLTVGGVLLMTKRSSSI